MKSSFTSLLKPSKISNSSSLFLKKFFVRGWYDDKIARTRPLVARNFSPAARQGRLHCSVEDSAIGRVLGQGCTDIETLMLRRPIDRLANANVAGMPTVAASVVSRERYFRYLHSRVKVHESANLLHRYMSRLDVN